jgi:hypothetical protein
LTRPGLPWAIRVEAPFRRSLKKRDHEQQANPHTAFVVTDPKEGNERKAQWHRSGLAA